MADRAKAKLVWADAGSIAGNPRNWRRHPDRQLTALSTSLERLGWVKPLVYNAVTERLIDGHARLAVTPAETVVPVFVVSVSEEAEAKALVLLDPLAAMAGKDDGKLSALVAGLDLGALSAALEGLTVDGSVEAAEGSVESSLLVVVECDGEADQAKLLGVLREEGYQAKAVTQD